MTSECSVLLIGLPCRGCHSRGPSCPPYSLVDPAVTHEFVHFRGAVLRALHPISLFDEGHDFRPLHLLHRPEAKVCGSPGPSICPIPPHLLPLYHIPPYLLPHHLTQPHHLSPLCLISTSSSFPPHQPCRASGHRRKPPT